MRSPASEITIISKRWFKKYDHFEFADRFWYKYILIKKTMFVKSQQWNLIFSYLWENPRPATCVIIFLVSSFCVDNSLQLKWHNTDGRVPLKAWLPIIKCGAITLCGTNEPLFVLALKRWTKRSSCVSLFFLYVDNTNKLHVEWQTTKYDWLCFTIVAILEPSLEQHKKTWTNDHSERASGTNLRGP